MASLIQYQKPGTRPEDTQTACKHDNIILALRTLSIYTGFLCLGMCNNILGPSFSDIELLLDTDTANLSTVFIFTNVGYLVGSALVAVVFDRIPPEPQLGISLAVAATATALALLYKRLILFFVAMGIQGAASAYIDAGTQAYCLSVWKGHRLQDTVLQGIFVAWSIGSTIVPLVLQPFLSFTSSTSGTKDNGCGNLIPVNNISINTSTDSTLIMCHKHAENVLSNFTLDMNQNSFNAIGLLGNSTRTNVGLNVGYGYIVTGALVFPAVLFYFIIYFTSNISQRSGSSSETSVLSAQVDKKQGYILVGMFSLLLLLYVGVEVVCGGFLALFVGRAFSWTNSQSPLLTSLFWSGTGIGRFLGALISFKMSPSHMLAGNLILSALGFLLMSTLAQVYQVTMWCAVVLAGLGLSTTYPSAYLWFSRYMTPSGLITGIFTFSGSVGATLLPLLAGFLFKSVTPWTFAYLLVATSAGLLVIFFTIVMYTNCCMDDSSASKEIPEVAATESLTKDSQAV